MPLGTRHQVHVAVNAGQAEHVLVFQVRAVAPFVHLHGHGVAALFHIARNVKFGVVVGALAVARLPAVHPHVEGRIHPVEVQVHPLSLPGVRQGEVPAVRAHGIGLLLYRIALHRLNEGRIVGEGIGDIDIQRSSVALHLPVGGNLYLLPGAHVEGRLVKQQRTLLGGLCPVEFPFPVKEHHP